MKKISLPALVKDNDDGTQTIFSPTEFSDYSNKFENANESYTKLKNGQYPKLAKCYLHQKTERAPLEEYGSETFAYIVPDSPICKLNTGLAYPVFTNFQHYAYERAFITGKQYDEDMSDITDFTTVAWPIQLGWIDHQDPANGNGADFTSETNNMEVRVTTHCPKAKDLPIYYEITVRCYYGLCCLALLTNSDYELLFSGSRPTRYGRGEKCVYIQEGILNEEGDVSFASLIFRRPANDQLGNWTQFSIWVESVSGLYQP